MSSGRTAVIVTSSMLLGATSAAVDHDWSARCAALGAALGLVLVVINPRRGSRVRASNIAGARDAR